jgi:hypothetical protein
LGARARAAFLERFTEARHVAAYLDLISEMMADGKLGAR